MSNHTQPLLLNKPLLTFCTCVAFLFILSGPHSIYNESEYGWTESLPPCPCENPDFNGVKLNDGWAKDMGNIEKYHKGSTACYRSYPYVRTNVGKSCQQCCYDANGKLITEGSGAGTPDKVSTCSGEKTDGSMRVKSSGLWGHYFKDVRPWSKLGGEECGWKEYNKLWVPNKGNNCESNKVPSD